MSSDYAKDGKRESVSRYFPVERLSSDSILAQIGTDLTWLAGMNQLEPVYYRDSELEEIMKILGRRQAANPMILGEAGVGKTAVCRLLAMKIVQRTVPPWLEGCKIVETSFERMYSIVENMDNPTAENMKTVARIVEECKKRPVILFMDEIHTIVGYPYSSKVIMPAIADGSLRVIGATTLKEYRRYVERNEALVRRFTPVYVREPSATNTSLILNGLKPAFEKRYTVEIDPAMLQLAVSAGDKYIHNVYQPSRSIQLLEDAAVTCRYENRKQLTSEDIMRAVSRRTGIPGEILSSRGDMLHGLEEALNHRVLGQEEVIAKIAARLFITRSGVGLNPQRPNGVFLFAGPTGVGKTELAKALSSFLTGSERNMVRFDMSVYRGAYAIEALLGIPASGVSDEARVPPLTQAIKDHPYTVLVLDEIEKADPKVWKLFLSAFDEGRLRDLQGTEMYFDHVTIVMTTNLGFGDRAVIVELAEMQSPYEQLKSEVIKSIEDTFPREFLARVDEVLVFKQLPPTIVRGFVSQKIELLSDRLGKAIALSDDAMEFLVRRGFSDKYGARFLERTIEEHVSYELAGLKSGGEWDNMNSIEVAVSDDGQELIAHGEADPDSQSVLDHKEGWSEKEE